MPTITGKVRVWVKILAVDIAFDVARDGACPPRPRRSAERKLLSFVPCGAWRFQGPQEARLQGTVGIGARGKGGALLGIPEITLASTF